MDYYEATQAAKRRAEMERLQEEIAWQCGAPELALHLRGRREEREEREREDRARQERVRAYRAHQRKVWRQIADERARTGPDVPWPLPSWW
ncbi:hypothetical protein ACGFLS_21870 [Streptomyces abikoensis]|uniref:hypothetical protein n=1 Tax=Streptomyces abikoensis TaxID=97398 RepID=UPI003715A36A